VSTAAAEKPKTKPDGGRFEELTAALEKHKDERQRLEVWNRYADNREARASLCLEIENALKNVRMLDAETAAAWDHVADPEEGPGPGSRAKDIGAFVEMLVEIIFDPYHNGYRGETSTVFDAESGPSIAVDAGDKRYGRRLPNLLPALQAQDTRIGGSGVARFTGSPDPGPNFSP
jgi:hypothetical protein